MKKIVSWFTAIIIVASCQKDNSNDYPVQPVPFIKVQLKDNFWLPRINTNREITIPIVFGCVKKQAGLTILFMQQE